MRKILLILALTAFALVGCEENPKTSTPMDGDGKSFREVYPDPSSKIDKLTYEGHAYIIFYNSYHGSMSIVHDPKCEARDLEKLLIKKEE